MRALVVAAAADIGDSLPGSGPWGVHPISEHGRRTARAAAGKLRGWDGAYVISSPLRRAIQTAELLVDRIDRIEAAWADQAAGRSGTGQDGIITEPLDSVRRRLHASLRQHAEEATAERIIIVTHPACLSALSTELPGACSSRHPGPLQALQLRLGEEGWRSEQWRDLA